MRSKLPILALAAALLASQSPIIPALAAEAVQTISGAARVIDGDTVVVDGRHVRDLMAWTRRKSCIRATLLTTLSDPRAETRCAPSSASRSSTAISTANAATIASWVFAFCQTVETSALRSSKAA